ncbi:putative ABC transport system permease protein [Nocardia amikacinitolerans]|uniref:ABC transporter permease n=1 Tax=Nocardia amikacinitolerans TaxID=756689 RepID=UPI00082A21F2|nr:FtsX-like permease family protein [Nocardia amikacinitolerans]MCP2314962.1 putative ABC transport system permease protein [Nocardia amikacinitolerans]
MRTVIDRWRLFGLREFAVHRGRTLASVTVTAVSAAFLVAVFGLFGSLTGSIDRLVGGLAGSATLEVSGITDTGFPAAVHADVAGVPGVAAAVPMVRQVVSTAAGDVLLLGTDMSATALRSDLQRALETHLNALAATPSGVLVGTEVGAAEGDSLRLASTEVTVAGVVRDGRAARLNEGRFVLAALPVAQQVTGHADRIDSILIVPSAAADGATLRTAVEDAVDGRAVVAAPSLRAVQAGNGIRILQYMMLMGAALAFIVAAFLIYTTVTMAIAQRRATISMLRAVGGRGRTLVTDLLVEAFLVGALGGLIGSALGAVLGRLAVGTLPAALMQSVEARTVYILPLYAIPIAVLAAAGTSVAASAVAARQVYKVSPVEALAPVGASTADRVPAWLRWGAAVSAIGSVTIAAGLAVLRLGEFLWSGIALSMFFGASVTLCFALSGQLVQAATAVARRLGHAGELAAATLERAPRRVWATLMTVFMAVAVTVTITGSNGDLLGSVRDSVTPTGGVDFWVASHGPDQLPTGPALPNDLAPTIAGLPSVARVSEGQVAYATLGEHKIAVHGLGENAASPLFDDLDPRTRADIVAGRGVVLSRDLSRTLELEVGDELALRTPDGMQRTEVLAVVPYFTTLSGTAGIGLTQMRTWFDRPGATVLQVEGAAGTDAERLRESIRAVTPDRVHVYSSEQSTAGVESALRQGMAVSNALWVIVALIAAIALLTTLTLSVLERRRELGVLRAMGSSRRLTLGMVLAEAASVGIVGGGLGLVFGMASQYFFDRLSVDIMNIDVAYRPSAAVLAFAIGAVALSLLGAVPPAIRAARLNIIEAVGID